MPMCHLIDGYAYRCLFIDNNNNNNNCLKSNIQCIEIRVQCNRQMYVVIDFIEFIHIMVYNT